MGRITQRNRRPETRKMGQCRFWSSHQEPSKVKAAEKQDRFKSINDKEMRWPNSELFEIRTRFLTFL